MNFSWFSVPRLKNCGSQLLMLGVAQIVISYLLDHYLQLTTSCPSSHLTSVDILINPGHGVPELPVSHFSRTHKYDGFGRLQYCWRWVPHCLIRGKNEGGSTSCIHSRRGLSRCRFQVLDERLDLRYVLINFYVRRELTVYQLVQHPGQRRL